MVKNPPVMQETPVQFLGWENLLEKGQATHCSILGLPWWLRQYSSAMWDIWFQSLGWEGSPGGGHDNSFQYSYLENPHGQKNLVGCSPWGLKESDTTE